LFIKDEGSRIAEAPENLAVGGLSSSRESHTGHVGGADRKSPAARPKDEAIRDH